MAKRLHMTTADYLAIAISPALIMALVGSLVFFLISVLYEGDFVGRLNYAFGLFVFAAVLIGRISIEMGAERASIFALALGIAMFLALIRFVEFPSPLSHFINLGLMAIVWWCAHKLTWDCTLIDDDEDSSGEGLMQQIGVDGPATAEAPPPGAGVRRNELFEPAAETAAPALPWWRRLFRAKKRGHTPGLWVLYFSLAALPLYGIGQSWIPVEDIGRRRYAFGLLFVYVASALTLLVTTSFLGLRRYLRQRRIEMPVPMAGTWVGTGALLIAIVMFIALLIPRPAAEVAISQVPWRAGSPGGHSPSKYGVGNDGQMQQDGGTPTNEQPNDNAGDAQAPGPNKSSDGDSNSSDKKADGASQGSSQRQSDTASDQSSDKPGKANSQRADGEKRNESTKNDAANAEKQAGDTTSSSSATKATERREHRDSSKADSQSTTGSQSSEQPLDDTTQGRSFNHPSVSNSPQLPQSILTGLGSLAGVLKIAFYALLALCAIYLIWKYRRELTQAIAEIIREIRAFISRIFGGKPASESKAAESAQPTASRPASFADFRNPFASDEFRRLAPEELVRYTFTAFEAWANDHGCPRSPDRTPHELVRAAVAAESPMYDDARRMARLYSEVAYATRTISRDAANDLHRLWTTMAQPGN